jgi:hypothetical protein
MKSFSKFVCEANLISYPMSKPHKADQKWIKGGKALPKRSGSSAGGPAGDSGGSGGGSGGGGSDI